MNTTKQFWTLLKFQATVSPSAWMLPFAFCIPFVVMAKVQPSLNILMATQNLFLVVLFGGLILAPEIFAVCGVNPGSGFSAEFLRTRAVDKGLLARAKSALLYGMALVGPLAIVVYSLRSPDLQASMYPQAALVDCVNHLPGASLVKGPFGQKEVSVPFGNVLLAGWRAWEFLVLAMIVQAFIYLIYPLRFRRYLFWLLILGTSFAPVTSTMFGHGSTPWDMHLFFQYAAQPWLYWGAGIGLLVMSQLWCERRFAQLEQ